MAVKKPSGLVISRSGTSWTFSWKKGDSYSDQELKYKINSNAWVTLKGDNVKKNTTAKSITADNVTKIQFKVRGKKGSSWSDWTKEKVFTVQKPYAPSGAAELTQPFSTKFSYSIPNDVADTHQLTNSTWQHKLFADWNSSSHPEEAKWSGASSGTAGASYENTINEGGFSGTSYSYTRWFRARSNGWAGSTDWIYLRHVYAVPKVATNISAKYDGLSVKDGYSVSVEWNSPSSESHPIDNVTVQYLVSPPETTVVNVDNKRIEMTIACPNTDQSWQSLSDVSGVDGKRLMSFTVPTELQDDECVFVRVNNKHDDLTTYSEPVLVTGGISKLATPSISSVTPGGIPNLYTVTVDRRTEVSNAFIAVYLRTDSNQNPEAPIGIIPANSSSVSCIIPQVEEEISFGVRAFVADYTPVSAASEDEPTYYTITKIESIGDWMASEINWDGGAVPLPPTISVKKINETTAQIGWSWSWRDANSAEISWADHEDAWESTDEPSTYVVDNTNASRWNIAGLGVGTWYFRLRLMKMVGESITYGTYSDTFVLKLSSSPDTPSLVLSDGIIAKTGEVTCYWAYVSNDGTPQMYAEVCEAFFEYIAVVNPTGNPFTNGYYELVNGKYVKTFDTTVVSGKIYYVPSGAITYSEPLGSTNTSQHITLSAEKLGWQSNETHNLALRVVAASGEMSDDWSSPVSVTIADEMVATIVNTSLVVETETTTDEDDHEVTRTYKALKSLPMTAQATGAGVHGTTDYVIERAEDYQIDRPDGTTHDGYEGETVFIGNQNGEDPITINQEDLWGYLDDGAKYRLIAIVRDPYGQTKEDSVEFEVHWTHQATIPEATIEIDPENHITKITPSVPSEYVSGDSVDIYRLSADTPELIYSGSEFGTTYVDPYPTLGEFGGHRIVYKTLNGDYISDDDDEKNIAWTDYEASENPNYRHDLFGIVIDFDGEQLILPYNVSINNSWVKDFTKTKYLGGSIQGDWNPAVERESSATTTIPIVVDPDMMSAIRRLAVYPGVCHVRTPDGSSYTANIDIRDDREEKWVPRLSKVSLTIKKVDAEGFDGMTLEEWEEL